MPTWRCPHCRTPQTEAARCWVCGRSSTTCSTCGNFRRAVAAGYGYCGLDAKRATLRGDEIRPCWTREVPAPPPLGLFELAQVQPSAAAPPPRVSPEPAPDVSPPPVTAAGSGLPRGWREVGPGG